MKLESKVAVYGVPFRSLKVFKLELYGLIQESDVSYFPDLSSTYVVVVGMDLGLVAYLRARKLGKRKVIFILDLHCHFQALRIPVLGVAPSKTSRFTKSVFALPPHGPVPYVLNTKLLAYSIYKAAAKSALKVIAQREEETT